MLRTVLFETVLFETVLFTLQKLRLFGMRSHHITFCAIACPLLRQFEPVSPITSAERRITMINTIDEPLNVFFKEQVFLRNKVTTQA